jgi:hypothetical protein
MRILPLDRQRPSFTAQHLEELIDAPRERHALFVKFGEMRVSFDSRDNGAGVTQWVESTDCVRCDVEILFLVPDRYRVNLAVCHGCQLADWVGAAAYFNVSKRLWDGRSISERDNAGSVFLPHHCLSRFRGRTEQSSVTQKS